MTLDQMVRSVPTPPGRKTLAFDEVAASGRPAVFLEFGDSLLYLGGEVFILRDMDPFARPYATPPILEQRALVHAVGFETGWHHCEGCDCDFCSVSARANAA
jgi:hypothetical protein